MITLVVKVTGDPRGGLHGTVSRVASGETRTFAGSVQLVALVEEWSACAPAGPVEGVVVPGAHAAPRSDRAATEGGQSRLSRSRRAARPVPGPTGADLGARG